MPDTTFSQFFEFQHEPEFLEKKVSRHHHELHDRWGGKHPLKGKSPDKHSIQLCTNDYLCIANDSRIIEAEISVLRKDGHGDVASRIWGCSRQDPIKEFERRLAKHMCAQDAVVTTSGYTANVGLIQAIATPDIPLYVDMKAHMSLWEGAMSARVKPIPFRHNDPGNLESLVKKYGQGIVVIDALYSTDGAIAPLADFVTICELYGCVIVVDETHSFGTQGPRGSGLVAELGLADQVHFRTMGMSKAVAARGGAVVCSRRNAEFYRYEALPSIFSTGVMPHEIAGYDKALDIFESEPWRRDKLHNNHKYLRLRLDALGYNVDASDSQIISLESGEPKQTIILRDALEERGVFGSIFLPPATPLGRCLMRFSVNCGLSNQAINKLLKVCEEIREEVSLSNWRSTRLKVGIIQREHIAA